MKTKINISLILFSLLILAGFTKNSLQDEPAGKKLFMDAKCTSCHSMEAFGLIPKTPKKNIPDLSFVGDRHNADFIKLFITKQEKMHDANHPIAYKGSDEELVILADWLASLKAEVNTPKQTDSTSGQ